jgi:predicted transcriptional regulator
LDLHFLSQKGFFITPQKGENAHMKCLTERMNLAKIVLRELNRQPRCRTEIELRTVRKAGTHAAFEGIFRYLVQGGYVQKSEAKHRAEYVLTEKGAKLLEAIQ